MYSEKVSFNSDYLKHTMHPSDSFENLLLLVQKSNLNFKLEMSPFSAIIYLRKSFIKDKSGTVQLPTFMDFDLGHVQSENQILREKILKQDNDLKLLQSDFENAVNDCEEANKVNKNLETKLTQLNDIVDRVSVKNEEVDDKKFSELETQLIEKDSELLIVVGQNKNYKIEVRNVYARYEKVINENKSLKLENENLYKELKNMSVACKSSKQDLKENVKKQEIEKAKLKKEIQKLEDYKEKNEAEARELKRNKKKALKMERKELKNAAEIEVKKMKAEREKVEIIEDFDQPSDDNNLAKLLICPHSPQCTLREPCPPPHGPKTLQQVELEEELDRKEAIQSVTESLLEFMQEPDDTLDDTVAKLEAIKPLLEPDVDLNKESQIDKLIEEVKMMKEAIKIYFEDMEDGLPRHYWGGEDASELIFLDEDE